jgi:hypothetical protein
MKHNEMCLIQAPRRVASNKLTLIDEALHDITTYYPCRDYPDSNLVRIEIHKPQYSKSGPLPCLQANNIIVHILFDDAIGYNCFVPSDSKT